jgi:hypothetical protein
LDVVSTVGAVIDAVAAGRGARTAVAPTTVPHTTGRGWVRRFGARAGGLVAAWAALAVELGDDGFVPGPGSPARAALGALSAAWRALLARVGLRAPARWAFASLVTGGKLIATTTDPLSIVIGRRRLIPPAP